jgi:hypothetical protein
LELFFAAKKTLRHKNLQCQKDMLNPNNDQTRSKDKPVDVKQMGRYLEVPHLGRAEKINIQTTINTSSFSQPDYRSPTFLSY